MNAIKKAALFCALLLTPFAALAQAPVSGTRVQDGTGTGNLLPSGNWCFNAACLAVTSGAFSGNVTAGTQTVTVVNASSVTVLTVPGVVVGSGGLSWDSYIVPGGASISGRGAPSIACQVGAQYTQGDSTPANAAWVCSNVSGQAVWVKGTPSPGPSNVANVTASEIPVTASATPSFGNLSNSTYMVLSQNVTSWAVAAGLPGQTGVLTFCENATGGFTLGAAPANVMNWPGLASTAANQCTSVMLTYNSSTMNWNASASSLAGVSSFLSTLSGCGTSGFAYIPSSNNCQSITASGAGLTTNNVWAGGLNSFSPGTSNILNPSTAFPGLIGYWNPAHMQNIPSMAGGPLGAAFVGDSVWACQAGVPAAQYCAPSIVQDYFQDPVTGFGPNGSGIVTVIPTQSAAIPPFVRGGWNILTGTGAFSALSSDFGPTQSGVNAGGNIALFTGLTDLRLSTNVLAHVSLVGDIVDVEGETTPATGACTLEVDGNVITTTLGGSSGSNQPYISSFPIPNSTPLTVHSTIDIIPTSTSNTCAIYGAGTRTTNRNGFYSSDYAVGSCRSDCWGTNTATQLAFLALQPVPPSIIGVNIGINDITNGAGSTQTTYQTHLSNLVTGAHALFPLASIFILDQQNVTGTPTTITKAQVQQSEHLMAIQFPYVTVGSIADFWGTLANAQQQGLMAGDAIHESIKGGMSMAHAMIPLISDMIPPRPLNSVAVNGNDTIIPLFYADVNNQCTASGTTITCPLAFTGSYLPVNPNTTLDTHTCTDANYIVTGATPLSINVITGVVTYTATAGTPGATSANCNMSFHDFWLDGSSSKSSATFDVSYPNFGTTGINSMTLFGTTPGEQINLIVRCGNGSTCPIVNYPSQLDNIPTAASIATFSNLNYFVTSAIMRSATQSDPLQPLLFTSVALPTASVAVGACITATATITSAQSSAGHRLTAGMSFTATALVDPGIAFDAPTVKWTTTNVATVRTCNRGAAPTAPNANSTYAVTAQ